MKKTNMPSLSSLGFFGFTGVFLEDDGDDEEEVLPCYNFVLSVQSYRFLCLIEQQP